jgi:phosphatidate cytidylyltransferase
VNTAKKSDLGVRSASAVVMVAVAASAFWLGGAVFTAFLVAIAIGLFWEWWGLISRITQKAALRIVWLIGGAIYIAWPTYILNWLWVGPAKNEFPYYLAAFALVLVVVVDVSAYAAGRTFGGKKIAPSISPSKTWAGLYGGMAGASLFAVAFWGISSGWEFGIEDYLMAAFAAALMTCIAQGGDFFESWMKRRAGVKDSGNLIPGHGGLLDRLDGHLAVLSTLPVVVGMVLS